MGGAQRYPSPCASALMGIAALHPSYANTPPQSRGAMPELCKFIRPSKRGRRECRVLAAPAVSCAISAKKRTRAYRYSWSTPAFPAQWFDGLYRALLGDEFLLPPSPTD